MNKALVIVDMQTHFLNGLPIDAVTSLIEKIAERAKKAHKKGWKVIPVEFQGAGPTIADLTFSFSQERVMKREMGGGKQVANKHELDFAEVVGVYTDECVMSTASGLVKCDVKTSLNIDLTLPAFAKAPDWQKVCKLSIEQYIGRFHKDTPGMFQIV